MLCDTMTWKFDPICLIYKILKKSAKAAWLGNKQLSCKFIAPQDAIKGNECIHKEQKFQYSFDY